MALEWPEDWESMTTAEQILFILESNKDTFISGEEMANQCGVSRNAVWKAIRDLRGRGYSIEAVSNKGYKLSGGNDIISAEGIKAQLGDNGDRLSDIYVFDNLESTSDKAKELAMKGATHGTVVIAASQSSGRGRRDHSFFSPEGGLYFSIVLKPEKLPSTDSDTVTKYIGGAVVDSIKELTGISAYIDGINDLYVDGRKICGILLEAGSEFDSNTLQWIVAGIGINFDSDIDSFPAEVRSRASSLFRPGQAAISKNELVADILGRIL